MTGLERHSQIDSEYKLLKIASKTRLRDHKTTLSFCDSQLSPSNFPVLQPKEQPTDIDVKRQSTMSNKNQPKSKKASSPISKPKPVQQINFAQLLHKIVSEEQHFESNTGEE